MGSIVTLMRHDWSSRSQFAQYPEINIALMAVASAVASAPPRCRRPTKKKMNTPRRTAAKTQTMDRMSMILLVWTNARSSASRDREAVSENENDFRDGNDEYQQGFRIGRILC